MPALKRCLVFSCLFAFNPNVSKCFVLFEACRHQNANFRWNCGASVKSETAEDKKKTVSFTAFKKKKEERSYRFQP